MLEEVQPLAEPGIGELVEKEAPLQIQGISFDVLGWCHELCGVAPEPNLERVHDGARDLLLNGENVFQLPVVRFGP